MALQMRVYKEIHGVEAKVQWGMSWRQMLAGALMLVVGGGETFVFFWLLHQTNLGAALLFVVCAPLAAWGWWRPKGLMPEKYAVYVLRHKFGSNLLFRDGPASHHSSAKPSVNEHQSQSRRRHA
ncbi:MULTISPECIES: PrgI family protein [Bifidobacterium]|uniref:PrgI family protein n=2 Tax=Bifidobacterium TaxID=1678 RepID=A0A261FTK2_9BIFI|nr:MULTISPECIES: PrgI family protein [Bifidobacterium]OZG62487.1 PrgI family protein [Bifidobacterium lemurum]OZG69023.1 PrgI family protein [Bifidobacterium eulemuris]QOL31449.1 PrgI family protein [Bifidobacterium eulemuris]QOL33828.1 PrgI family protein [Bifidobacterium lemurum]